MLRNENVEICALVDPSEQPTSSLNHNLESLHSLAKKCGGCPVFSSVDELLVSNAASEMDGAIVCTPHSTHFAIADTLLQEGLRRRIQTEDAKKVKQLHIFLEKPMTTDVKQAKKLYDAVHAYQLTNDIAEGGMTLGGCFLLNHTANYRKQTRVTRDLIQTGEIGKIRHISVSMAAPLSWLFGNPLNIGWNETTEGMLGNGFAWGQSSHILAWIYHVAGEDLIPQKVYCFMNHSEASGADISHSATIHCDSDVVFSLSGTCLLPGNEHGDPPVGKEISIRIYGSNGAILYVGNDHDPGSGRLELRRGKAGSAVNNEGSVEVLCEHLGFQFENTDKRGKGPESLQSFIAACLGKQDYYVGANSLVGFRTVQTIDAMYRSHESGKVEEVAFSTGKRAKTKHAT